MPKGKRGGRNPGEWKLVQPEQIRAYRADHKMSRATMSKMLGVSATTIQNWEIGNGTATHKAQVRIKELLDSAPPATLMSARRSPPAGGNDAQLEATGKIVAALVSRNANVSQSQMVEVIRQVRQALS
jgi:DNA-binding XRE family transcriptional regulator